MRTWHRVIQDTWCGRCPAVIPKGEPCQVIRIDGLARPLVRCQACADSPAPKLAPLPEAWHFKTKKRVKPMTQITKVLEDWKQKQAEP